MIAMHSETTSRKIEGIMTPMLQAGEFERGRVRRSRVVIKIDAPTSSAVRNLVLLCANVLTGKFSDTRLVILGRT